MWEKSIWYLIVKFRFIKRVESKKNTEIINK